MTDWSGPVETFTRAKSTKPKEFDAPVKEEKEFKAIRLTNHGLYTDDEREIPSNSSFSKNDTDVVTLPRTVRNRDDSRSISGNNGHRERSQASEPNQSLESEAKTG